MTISNVTYNYCSECGKEHKTFYGVFPDPSEKYIDYTISHDPNDANYFIFTLCVYAEAGTVSFSASCSLDNECIINYLEKLPFEIPNAKWTNIMLSREEIIESGFKESAIKLLETIMTTDDDFRVIYSNWANNA